MTTEQTPWPELGGSVSIGNEQKEDQEPFPDGEELPADEEEESDEERDPEPTSNAPSFPPGSPENAPPGPASA